VDATRAHHFYWYIKTKTHMYLDILMVTSVTVSTALVASSHNRAGD